MGCFLLNEFGEVLLELASGMDFCADLRLEVNENEQTAVLKNDNGSFTIDFVHEDLMYPLKKNRYVYVVERNKHFYAVKNKLAKVVFVE